jgi:D-aminopeptidase
VAVLLPLRAHAHARRRAHRHNRGGPQGHGAPRHDCPAARRDAVRVEIRFKSYRPAELLSWLPAPVRVDAHAVAYTVKDMPEASRF